MLKAGNTRSIIYCKMNRTVFSLLFGWLLMVSHLGLQAQTAVSEQVMQKIYQEVRTPFKYGLVLVPEDNKKMVDSPSIFRQGKNWYMTYIVFDGKGYETWLACSRDLLTWKTLGRILSASANSWDSNQKAGYIALQSYDWGGNYSVGKYEGKYWMSYLGGATQGYEAGVLGIGIASTDRLIAVREWHVLDHPVISAKDADARWYDHQTIFKSTVIWDKKSTLGHPFVMFYNAKGGKKEDGLAEAERIAMAVSDDMVNWKRFGDRPVIDHHKGISGDAFIARISDVWVLFYFGAFWKPKAFDRFACSYDLVHWTDWAGEDLISPSESYDSQYAHKPFVIKHKGVVYHFYCAVDSKGRRGIAVATSVNAGKSILGFTD